MVTASLAEALQRLREDFAAIEAAVATAGAAEQICGLQISEGIRRRVDAFQVAMTAALDRNGGFADRGYRTPTAGLQDVLGLERFEAQRLTVAAEQVQPRTTLHGSPLPPKLPATAERFAAGKIRLGHVAVIAGLLDSGAAHRISPDEWANAEIWLAVLATDCTPTQLRSRGYQRIELLDQDGPEPDDSEPEPRQVNELQITPNGSKPGGRISGRFDSAADFAAIVTAIGAIAAPRDSHDPRRTPERQADALADVCRFVLDHADHDVLPDTGGSRPQLMVLIRLEDLEKRARAGMLDLGDHLTPAQLRTLACDANVIPAVLNGEGRPIDVADSRRVIPTAMRRAVLARDRGCAHPGCDRPPSWCEIHHVIPWEHGGPTVLDNLVMLCRVHHRLIHSTCGWTIQIADDGFPAFVPPAWIDLEQRPRRRATGPPSSAVHPP